ncbi:putative holin-like toxin [Falsibacillus albus]|nr:putative holin-like toxin [Falsibacillus albus]
MIPIAETMQLMIAFGSLIIAIVAVTQKKK